jgi:hypothetical protein
MRAPVTIMVVLSLLSCQKKDGNTSLSIRDTAAWNEYRSRSNSDTVLFPLLLPVPLDSAIGRLALLGFEAGEYNDHYRNWLGLPAGLHHNGADTLTGYRITWKLEDSLLAKTMYGELSNKLNATCGPSDSSWDFQRNVGYGARWRSKAALVYLINLNTSVNKKHDVSMAVHVPEK